jgi:WD40 repeat protein
MRIRLARPWGEMEHKVHGEFYNRPGVVRLFGHDVIGHNNSLRVSELQIRSDGRQMISTNPAKTEGLIWSLDDERLAHRLRWSNDFGQLRVTAARYDASGAWAIFGLINGEIHFVSSTTGRVMHSIAPCQNRGDTGCHASVIISIAASPNGDFFASLDVSGLLIQWDMQSRTRRRAWSLTNRGAGMITISPDSSRLAAFTETIGAGSVFAFSSSDGAEQLRIETRRQNGVLISGPGAVTRIAFNPTELTIAGQVYSPGSLLATASGRPETEIVLWGVENGAPVMRLGAIINPTEADPQRQTSAFTDLQFGPGGTLYATNIDRCIYHFLLDPGVLLRRFCSAFVASAHSLALHPDGERIYSGHYGLIDRWSLTDLNRTNAHRNSLTIPNGLASLRGFMIAQPDGETNFAFGNGRTISLARPTVAP